GISSNYWQRQLSRRRFVYGAVAGGAGIALVACGGGSNSQATTTSAGSSGTPKQGGTIIGVLAPAEVPHNDPHLQSVTTFHSRASGLVYNRLLRRKLAPELTPFDFGVEGDLAASWEQPDDLTIVFKLNPKAKWQNFAPVNGRGVTADDVVYSTKRQIDLKVA